MISIVEWIESPFARSKLIAELENKKENYQSWSLPVPHGVSGNLLLTGYYKYYQLMLEPISINSGLLKLLKKATHQCVDNLSPSDASTDIDIDQVALVAILVLLRYHPQKEVGQFYIDHVHRIMRWSEEEASGNRLKRKRKAGPARTEIVFGGDPDSSRDRLDEVLDVIMEHGKFYKEWKEKHK